MNRREFLGGGFGALALATASRASAATETEGFERPTVEVKGDFGGAKMYCFGTRCDAIGLSTVFVSKTGHVAVVDGGRDWGGKDGAFLYGKLMELGGHVDRWFVTHPHDDHYGALRTIMARPDFRKLKIDQLVFSFPKTEWILGCEKNNDVREFLADVKKYCGHIKVRRYVTGEVWKPDSSLAMETLNEPFLEDHLINGNSICQTVTMGEHRILVTGDMTKAQGRWLMKLLGSERIRHDICFLSHHGQNGGDKEFYAAVAPETVIWPTPAWLWDNIWPKSFGGNRPSGIGTGPWNANYTKCWLQELKIMKQHLLCRNDVIFG